MENLTELELEIIKLTKDTPNDMELGQKIRALIKLKQG